jgi:hypothetical protein
LCAVSQSFYPMNTKQAPSSDWMLMIAALLVATLVAAAASPQAELDSATGSATRSELASE